jgi:hypothetical protein
MTRGLVILTRRCEAAVADKMKLQKLPMGNCSGVYMRWVHQTATKIIMLSTNGRETAWLE